MKCPDHGLELIPRETQYGTRRICPRTDCTVVCWDGGTSTPADQETRTLRTQCHQGFDPLWQAENGPFFRAKSDFNEPHHRRNRAYAWLSQCLGVTRDECHFGYFDRATCSRALRFINAKSRTLPPARPADERFQLCRGCGAPGITNGGGGFRCLNCGNTWGEGGAGAPVPVSPGGGPTLSAQAEAEVTA